MKEIEKNNLGHVGRKYVMFLCDFLLWNLAYYITFMIIYNEIHVGDFNQLFFFGEIIINVCFTVVFLAFKMYDKIWRYADVADFFTEWLACIVANTAFYFITRFSGRDFGTKIPIVMLLVSTFLLFMFRFSYRLMILNRKRAHLKNSANKRLLIVGAGEGAYMLLRELSNNPYNEYRPIGMVDDDPNKQGRSVLGVKVLGKTDDIPEICKKYRIDCIIFAILSITQETRRSILEICHRTNVELKAIPRLYNSMEEDGEIIPQIRNVEVEDLLGREPVNLNTAMCEEYIKDRVVLVTGGGGSIGSELCRQIITLKPKNMIILDIYENNAYEIQQELKRKYGDSANFEVQIASVRDKEKIESIFKEKGVNVVFHAAAHKHVPLMETNPEEAVKNNVFGTLNMLETADKFGIEKFVLISTDKAVNPTNVMGCTKRICEMLVQSINKNSKTDFVAVRFGNVLGSNGSVIPLFKKQIEEGGPVTVTHPEITRFFMTIPEAVSLVLTAGAMAKGGEIFVLDMGEPVKINDLAFNLIRLSGFEPGKEIEIVYTGLRPGEKIYEELLMDEEGMVKTDNEKIYIGKPIKIDEDVLFGGIDRLRNIDLDEDKTELEEILSKMVDTFKHNKGDNK